MNAFVHRTTSELALRSRSGRVSWPLLAVVLVAVGAAASVYVATRPDRSDLVHEARIALRHGDWAQARDAAAQAYELAPSNDVILIAGEATTRLDDAEDALAWYRRLEDDGGEDYFIGRTAQASLCFHLARLSEAERSFAEVLRTVPDNITINRSMAILLNAEGRRWEACRYYATVLQHGVFAGQVTIEDLLMMGSFEEPFDNIPLTTRAIATVPDDPIPLLGRIPLDFIKNRYSDAVATLEKVVAARPDLLQAHALLARALLDTGRPERLPEWNAALPATAETFPDIWFMKGRWAKGAGQHAAAARCFWEAIRREPNHRGANYQLGQTLVLLKREEDAAPFLERAHLLADLQGVLHPIFFEGPRPDGLQQAANLTGSLGRLWEQYAWIKFVLQDDPDNQDAAATYRELQTRLSSEQPPRTLASSNPALRVDLSGLPLPDWKTQRSAPTSTIEEVAGTIGFEDIASEVGLEFTYFNSDDPETVGLRIFETTGGGVAALDYDVDGWPDLYFTQGCHWPVIPSSREHVDKLFRSLGGERVQDVTAPAGLGDALYGQGIAAGDFDNDGFPDLYLANIGANRLYRNNGDGTFTDVSGTLPQRPARWTTSVMIADLDGDTEPDLFDVNYLAGDDVYTRLCGAENKRACAPSAFAGEQDDIYLNRGDGNWAAATGTSRLEGLVSKGLGLLAADFDGSGRLNVFVANDGLANFYLMFEGTGSDLKLRDAALEKGLAFDGNSRGQACMGVAADDLDGDTRLDLFVTNFYEDSNTLYGLLPGHLFEDRTREVQLRDASYNFLGFGTQALDADLDGRPDLVIANGHVDDYTYKGAPFRMRPQLYRNLGGRFEEVLPASSAGYMQAEHLGRALVRLDFNRDGLPDFAVSHLDTPAALVRNETTDAGHFLAVRLAGTESCRDALGTTVTVETASGSRTMQLTGGDGYQATNERVLICGLGSADEVSEITVQWPSGVRQTFGHLAADTEILIMEGHDRVFPLPR